MKKSALALALSVVATGTYAQSTDEKLRILQQEIDELKAQVQKPAAGSAAQTGSATTISGYGAFNYKNDERPTQADLRRFVFGLHHRFDDRLTFHSEVEFEHAVVSKDDELKA